MACAVASRMTLKTFDPKQCSKNIGVINIGVTTPRKNKEV